MASLVIYDSETLYTTRLAGALSSRAGFDFDVHGFTKEQPLRVFLSNMPADVLLVAEKNYTPSLASGAFTRILILREDGTNAACAHLPAISKYQSADELATGILAFYLPAGKHEDDSADHARVWSVFSPISRCGKTSLLLCLGQMLCRRTRVLYVTLDPYSYLVTMMTNDSHTSLSDLLYHLAKEDDCITPYLSRCVSYIGALPVLPPASHPSDIYESGPDLFQKLLSVLRTCGLWDILLFDPHVAAGHITPYLALCDRVYLVERDDALSKGTFRIFQERERDNLLPMQDHLRLLRLPEADLSSSIPASIASLPATAYGPVAKKIMKEEGF